MMTWKRCGPVDNISVRDGPGHDVGTCGSRAASVPFKAWAPVSAVSQCEAFRVPSSHSSFAVPAVNLTVRKGAQQFLFCAHWTMAPKRKLESPIRHSRGHSKV